jgi:hypothetical protein
MAKYTLEEAPEFAVLPVDAIIQVTCTDLKEIHVPGKDGKDGWVKLEFTFNVDGVPSSLQDTCGMLVDTKIWGSVPARFTTHIDNKLRQWTTGLLGMELNEGFELDTDMLLNRKARAVIGQYKKSNGTFQHQVAGLLPLVQAATPPPVQAQRPGDMASEALAAAQTHAQQPVQQPVLSGGWNDDPPPF